ncbi:MAG: glycoside hydrolase family 11 protein, partial [Cyanobacteria bacterium P01_A01_bin.84]
GFQITMQKEEALNYSGHATETVGWFAIDAGNGNWSQNNYLAGQTGDSINHKWQTVDFKNNFSEPPVFLASTATSDGIDPVSLRYNNLSNDQVQIKLQEDTSKDVEINHTFEAVNFLAIAGNNSLRGIPLEMNPSGTNSGSGLSEVDWNNLVEQSKTDSFIQYNQSGPGPRVNFNRTLVWESSNFKGDYIAITAPDAKAITFHTKNSTGGHAAYVNEFVPQFWNEPLRLDDIHKDVTIEGRVEHNFDNKNRWAFGPKVSAHSCNKRSECEDTWESGWYENYIVENSSWTPEQMHERYTKPEFDGKYLGETYHDGSVYKHYSVMHPGHGKWKMFWAVRQDYRETGEVHIAPILEKWRENGMKNGYLSWIEYNMELFGNGPWEGTLKISDFKTTDNWKTGK